MGEVADLFGTLGLRVDHGAWAKGDAALSRASASVRQLDGTWKQGQGKWRTAGGNYQAAADKARRAARGIKDIGNESADAAKKADAAGGALNGTLGGVLKLAGAYVGGRAAYGAMVTFNATVEDSKNKIAGMLALTKKTDLADQLAPASTLMDNLAKRAATLPGTTSEYVAMLANLTRPITDAGLGMKDLEDLTVSAVVAAKALGVGADVGARDIDQALRGQYHSQDELTGKVLGSIGYEGEAGRAKFNALSKSKKASELKRGFGQKQIEQLAEAQGKSFNGIMSTLEDQIQQFFGKVGKPIFLALGNAIKGVNKFLDENAATIQKIADIAGQALVLAFDALGVALDGVVAVFKFFNENADITEALLITLGSFLAVFAIKLAAFAVAAAASWLLAFGPIIAIVAAVFGLVYVVRLLMKHPDKVRAAFATMWAAVADKANWVWQRLKDIGNRIKQFFVEDIPNAIKAAFKAAFEWIAALPVIKQMIDAWNGLNALGAQTSAEHEKMVRDSTEMSPEDFRAKYPQINKDAPLQLLGSEPTASLGPQRGGVSIGTVQVGDINVASTSADPVAVASAARKVFHEELGSQLRRTMDQVG